MNIDGKEMRFINFLLIFNFFSFFEDVMFYFSVLKLKVLIFFGSVLIELGKGKIEVIVIEIVVVENILILVKKEVVI